MDKKDPTKFVLTAIFALSLISIGQASASVEGRQVESASGTSPADILIENLPISSFISADKGASRVHEEIVKTSCSNGLFSCSDSENRLDQSAALVLASLDRARLMEPVSISASTAHESSMPFASGRNSAAGSSIAAAAVPLPSSFWLLGSALIGFIGFSRRTSV